RVAPTGGRDGRAHITRPMRQRSFLNECATECITLDPVPAKHADFATVGATDGSGSLTARVPVFRLLYVADHMTDCVVVRCILSVAALPTSGDAVRTP